jgi:hypothetical protein
MLGGDWYKMKSDEAAECASPDITREDKEPTRRSMKRYTLEDLKRYFNWIQSNIDIGLENLFLDCDEFELWYLLRGIIIALRLQVFFDLQDTLSELGQGTPKILRGLDLLYSVSRFIQSERRFPLMKEWNIIYSNLSHNVGLDMAKLLRKESDSAKSKSARKRQKQTATRKSIGDAGN